MKNKIVISLLSFLLLVPLHLSNCYAEEHEKMKATSLKIDNIDLMNETYVQNKVSEQRLMNRSILRNVMVFIGKVYVGELVVRVIDGIIEEITSKIYTDWSSYATRKLLKKEYTETLELDKEFFCSSFPPYGAGVKPYYCY